MTNKELTNKKLTNKEPTSFYLAKFALQVLENAVDRCDNKIVIGTAAEIERHAQKALSEGEIDQKLYSLRIRGVLDTISVRFQKHCSCKKRRI